MTMAIRPFTRLSFNRPLLGFEDRNATDSHSLNVERSAVRQAGGIPNKQLKGPDGHSILFNRPIEVKYANKDTRFRVNRIDHEQMLREHGLYIFKLEDGRTRQMSAQQADSLLAYGWMHDRHPNYDHSFIFVKSVFG